MDTWKEVLDNFTNSESCDAFKKTLVSARRVLNEDLADFEIEWFLDTLLEQPVQLIKTLQLRRSDSTWVECLADALALLAHLLEKFHSHIHKYYHQIVQVCVSGFDGLCRQRSLSCLLQVSRHSSVPALHVRHFFAVFQNSSVCRAPLALLLGSICLNQPHAISEHAHALWRVLLNMLDDSKLTGTVRSAVLSSACSVLTRFGRELPSADVLAVYPHLRAALYQPRCHAACLLILCEHAALFRERVSADVELRVKLMQSVAEEKVERAEMAQQALVVIYEQVAIVYAKEARHIEKVIHSELLKHAMKAGLRQAVALRALHVLGHPLGILHYANLPALEYSLRSGYPHHEDVSVIALCIENGAWGASEMVRAWLSRQEALWAGGDKKLARAVLRAPSNLKQCTARTLVSESCRSEKTQRCQAIWREIAQSEPSEDFNAESNAGTINELLDYIGKSALDVLRAYSVSEFREDGCEATSALSEFLFCVLNEAGGPPTTYLAAELADVLVQGAERYPVLLPPALSACCLATEVPTSRFLLSLRIEDVNDEHIQWRCCETLVRCRGPPPRSELIPLTLGAVQVVLSNARASATLQLDCVRTTDAILRTHLEGLDKTLLHQVCIRIQALKARYQVRDRTERELQRAVLLFMGRHVACCENIVEDIALEEESLILTDLRELLSVPGPCGAISLSPALLEIGQVSSPARDDAQAIVTWLSNKLSSSGFPCGVVWWAARAGADLTPLTSSLRLSILPQFLNCIYRERDASTRKLMLALLSQAVSQEQSEVNELRATLLQLLLKTQRLHTEGSDHVGVELVELCLNILRDDNVACADMLPVLLLRSLSEWWGPGSGAVAQLFAERLSLYTLDRIIELSKLSLATVTPSYAIRPSNRLLFHLLSSIATHMKKDVLDIILDAMNDSSISRVLGVINECVVLSDDATISSKVWLARGSLVPERIFALDLENLTECTMNVVLHFISLNAQVAMEKYEDTIDFFCSLIERVPMKSVDVVQIYISVIVKTIGTKEEQKDAQTQLFVALDRWISNLKLNEVTDSLEKGQFLSQHWMLVRGLRKMLDAFDVWNVGGQNLMGAMGGVRCWFTAAFALRVEHGDFFAQSAYLRDVVYVAFLALSLKEREDIFNDDSDSWQWLMSRLQNKIAKYLSPNERVFLFVNEHGANRSLLTFLDQIWPVFETVSTLEDQISLVAEVLEEESQIIKEENWDEGSVAVEWATKMVHSIGTPLHHRLRLFTSLPPHTMQQCATALVAETCAGVRLGELDSRGSAVLRALLVAVERSRRPTTALLDIIALIADDDSSPEWCGNAMERSTRAIALRFEEIGASRIRELIGLAYERSWEARTLGICHRLLMPLLRSSSPALCEELYSSWLEKLLSVLRHRPRALTPNRVISRCLLDYVRALTLLTLVFDKLPRGNIERSNSVLYSALAQPPPFHLVREVCKYCVALRKDMVAPSDSDDKMQELYRMFQCANFNCLCAALRCRAGVSSLFNVVLDVSVWEHLVDKQDLKLPLKPTRRVIRRPDKSPDMESTPSTSSTLNTVKSRIFLTTLTDNPLMYDLHEEEHETESDLEKWSESPSDTGAIYSHDCSSPLTALVLHILSRDLPSEIYLRPLGDVLTGSYHQNLKWLVAQVVCNIGDQLAPLRNALFASVLDTLEDGLLNQMHLHIIDTVLGWDDAHAQSSAIDVEQLKCLATALIHTAVELGTLTPNYLLEVMERLLHKHLQNVTLQDTCFRKYFEDTSWKRLRCVTVIKRVSRCGVRVERLAAALVHLINNKEQHQTTNNTERQRSNSNSDVRALRDVAQSLGAALAVELGPEAKRLRVRVTQELRRLDAGGYLTLLSSAAQLYPSIVDEAQVRNVINMLTKIVGREKRKCTQIIFAFVKRTNEKYGEHVDKQIREQIADMFDLVLEVLPFETDALSIDLVSRMRDMSKSDDCAEPPAKKRATEYIQESLVLSAWNSTDVDQSLMRVLRRASAALTNSNPKVSSCAFQTLANMLSTLNSFTRLSESIALASGLGQPNHARGSWVALQLFLTQVVEARDKCEQSALQAMLNMAQGSEALSGALFCAIGASMLGQGLQQHLVRDVAKNVMLDTRAAPAMLQLLHTLVLGTVDDDVLECVERVWTPRDAILRDLRLRMRLSKNTHFTLGNTIISEINTTFQPSDINEFSIQEMSACFGWLSDWEHWGEWGKWDHDNREHVKLPSLWTSLDRFKQEIEQYKGDCKWLREMWAACDQDSGSSGLHLLLLEVDLWPSDAFALSAISEIHEWRKNQEDLGTATIYPDRYCLAEWAARLMLRSVRLESSEDCNSQEKKSLRNDIVAWCSRANGTGQGGGRPTSLRVALHQEVLQCCKLLPEVYESETLRWIEQKVTAQRGLALIQTDVQQLNSTLEFAERCWREFEAISPPEDALRVAHLVLQLRGDTHCINNESVEEVIQKVKQYHRTIKNEGEEKKEGVNLCSLLLTAGRTFRLHIH
ncbi:unnamed protein product [Leptosia nina]|uniref:DNA-dependent protein kinase catalytic subunit CC3 domain-containing protein n=1 Tax=Leptosia nina TaxID=320188 RepID=A0AAV1JLV5_9NEOP